MAGVGRTQPSAPDTRKSGTIMVNEYRVGKWKRERQNDSWTGEKGRFEEVKVVRNRLM